MPKGYVSIKVSGDFLDLKFVTNGVMGSGNSAWPSTLELRADQLGDVVQTDNGTVKIDFVGEMEFQEFRTAIAVLAEKLEYVFGKPSLVGSSSHVIVEEALPDEV